MLAVDEDAVIADLRALAQFGKLGTGVNRTTFTSADMDARHWLLARMRDAGLDATIDGVGNVFGRAPRAQTAVVIGSHTDTVPGGGWLDGAMGVIFGLGVARARLRDQPDAIGGVDVISFADEEGTFLACLGSRSFCDFVSDNEITEARNADGTRLTERLQALALLHNPRVRFEPQRHRAYLEAHIEQGPRLIKDNIAIGAVTGIVGLRRRRVTFTGQADHAGTTPMALRRDAAFALFTFATSLAADFARLAGEHTVWNFGVVTVRPGAANVVPAQAELTVEFRDLSSTTIAALEAAFDAAVTAANGVHGVSVTAAPLGGLEPAIMDDALIGMIAEAAHEAGASCVRMPSGAGHDAMILARRMPSAMLFVPSIGGRSHDISENTSEEDIRRGLRVFAAATEKVIQSFGP
jgi:N-carbamoyl-L-amino-acid hydrolase